MCVCKGFACMYVIVNINADVTLSRSGHPNMLKNITRIKINRSVSKKYIKIYIYKKIINKLKPKTSKIHILLSIANQLRHTVTQA